ncbi:hypothetical protein LTR85_007240 [Meristemomyces frigidus]|nr:hypothetical protein LTR85_007240 [Meristemomyces frigidus]
MLTMNLSNADVCPLDGRRTTTELLVKLFVVHFTIIAAYCHVRSIRNEPIISFSLLFYAMEPLSLLAYYAVSIVMLMAAAIMALVGRSPVHRASFFRAPMWLFGKFSMDVMQHQRLGGPSAPTQKSRWTMKTLGRALLASALLAQCIGTIVLHCRRRAHDAVTLGDERVLGLGCSGLATVIVWFCSEISLWPFSEPVPIWDDTDTTAIDYMMWFVRDPQPNSRPYWQGAWRSIIVPLWKGSNLVFLALFASNKFRCIVVFKHLVPYVRIIRWNMAHSQPEQPYRDWRDGLGLDIPILSGASLVVLSRASI